MKAEVIEIEGKQYLRREGVAGFAPLPDAPEAYEAAGEWQDVPPEIDDPRLPDLLAPVQPDPDRYFEQRMPSPAEVRAHGEYETPEHPGGTWQRERPTGDGTPFLFNAWVGQDGDIFDQRGSWFGVPKEDWWRDTDRIRPVLVHSDGSIEPRPWPSTCAHLVEVATQEAVNAQQLRREVERHRQDDADWKQIATRLSFEVAALQDRLTDSAPKIRDGASLRREVDELKASLAAVVATGEHASRLISEAGEREAEALRQVASLTASRDKWRTAAEILKDIAAKAIQEPAETELSAVRAYLTTLQFAEHEPIIDCIKAIDADRQRAWKQSDDAAAIVREALNSAMEADAKLEAVLEAFVVEGRKPTLEEVCAKAADSREVEGLKRQVAFQQTRLQWFEREQQRIIRGRRPTAEEILAYADGRLSVWYLFSTRMHDPRLVRFNPRAESFYEGKGLVEGRLEWVWLNDTPDPSEVWTPLCQDGGLPLHGYLATAAEMQMVEAERTLLAMETEDLQALVERAKAAGVIPDIRDAGELTVARLRAWKHWMVKRADCGWQSAQVTDEEGDTFRSAIGWWSPRHCVEAYPIHDGQPWRPATWAEVDAGVAQNAEVSNG